MPAVIHSYSNVFFFFFLVKRAQGLKVLVSIKVNLILHQKIVAELTCHKRDDTQVARRYVQRNRQVTY